GCRRPDGAAAVLFANDVEGDRRQPGAGMADTGEILGGGPEEGLLEEVFGVTGIAQLQEREEPGPVAAEEVRGRGGELRSGGFEGWRVGFCDGEERAHGISPRIFVENTPW